jgi:hypothetical protein
MYRGFITWGVAALVLLVAFLVFALAGWPGEVDSCMTEDPNTCFCEVFDPVEASEGAPGIRQPVNTLFNLYSLITSFIVALFVFFDRRSGAATNVMRSMSPIADLYIFAVLFLGLGSMWFHASLKAWGGNFDGLSMYVYAAFLVFYTIRRIWASDLFFWLAYTGTVVGFFIAHILWQWELKSLVLILILVAAYLVFEVLIWVRSGKVMQGKASTQVLWLSAVACIGAATTFWALSQTGEALCDPNSAFQPHGLLWHPLAGAMAVLLYFYWREAEGDA